MRKSMLRSTICAIAFLGAATFSRADVPVSDPFEGEWSVTATPDEEAANEGQGKFEEAVLFHDNQFSAAVFAMFGFTPSAYAVNADRDRTYFNAILVSNDRGTLEWSGCQTPTGLDGTMVWTRDDGHAMHYVITGERQSDPAPVVIGDGGN